MFIELVGEIPCYETRSSLFHNRSEEPMKRLVASHMVFIYVTQWCQKRAQRYPMQGTHKKANREADIQRRGTDASAGLWIRLFFWLCTALMEFGGSGKPTAIGPNRSQTIHHARKGETLLSKQKLRDDWQWINIDVKFTQRLLKREFGKKHARGTSDTILQNGHWDACVMKRAKW